MNTKLIFSSVTLLSILSFPLKVTFASDLDIQETTSKISNQLRFNIGNYAGDLFLDSPRSIDTLAKNKVTYSDISQLNNLEGVDFEWMKGLDKSTLAKVSVTLLSQLISRDNFNSLYSKFQEGNKFNLIEKVDYIISEIEKVDMDAKLKLPPKNTLDRRVFFENNDYEFEWSPITKLMYRWEIRIPGLKDELIRELKYIK